MMMYQTQGRGDFAAALWLLSRYLHTSPLSSALPFLRVGDKSPPIAPHWLPTTTIFFTLIPASSRAWFCEFSFCYFIAALSASCVCFSWCFCGPSRRLPANRFFQTRHSFGIYLRRNTPLPFSPIHLHIQPGLAVTSKQRNKCLCRLVSTTAPSLPRCN